MRALAWVTFALGAAVGCTQVWFSRAGGVPAPASDAVRVATHNVHYIILGQTEGRWSEADWQTRRYALDQSFKALGADIVAFQEMESWSRGSDGSVNLARDWLLDQNPGFAAAASGDWRQFPSTQPILYRTAALTLEDQGWFFFSETPDEIYSRTFNGSFPAFASWAVLRDHEGRALRVVNVHFDFSSWENRRRSAELVRDRVAPWVAAGERVILLGDLNALHGSPTMDILEMAGFHFDPVPGATVHFDRGLRLYGAIDHIGISGPVSRSGGPYIQQRRFDGVWPSDHHPVIADLRLD